MDIEHYLCRRSLWVTRFKHGLTFSKAHWVSIFCFFLLWLLMTRSETGQSVPRSEGCKTELHTESRSGSGVESWVWDSHSRLHDCGYREGLMVTGIKTAVISLGFDLRSYSIKGAPCEVDLFMHPKTLILSGCIDKASPMYAIYFTFKYFRKETKCSCLYQHNGQNV